MAGNPNIKEAGKATQFPHNDPTRGGRKKSIRNTLREALDKGTEIVIPAKDVVEVRKNGDIVIKGTNRDVIVQKLLKMATSNEGQNARALQMVIEHDSGKPTQPFEFSQYENKPTIFIDATGHLPEKIIVRGDE